MSKTRIQYRCRDCGSVAPRWAGRCSHCGEWNALEEEVRVPTPGPGGRAGGTGGTGGTGGAPVSLDTVAEAELAVQPTGLAELDRVLGGGLVPSSVTLMAGEPGIGKSTLLLQMLSAVARQGRRGLLVSAEESPAQVGARATRLGLARDGVWVSADADLGSIRSGLADLRPDVVVVDSIQMVTAGDGGAPAGSVTAVRACASALIDAAKPDGPAIVLVGHVTKDGSIAGPRVLEHLVDTVLSFEGERHQGLRTLRAVKHRFGPVGELGLWEMTPEGLREVADGGAFLLADRRPGTPGSVVFAGMEGRRPLLVEVQALVARAGGAPPRRVVSGYEATRLAQLVAVLDRRAGVPLQRDDVYVSAVGGVRLGDPGADLAVAGAIASAATGRPAPADLVLIGEIGLGGEIRQVAHGPRRLAEAARMGFTRALAPPGMAPVEGIRTIETRTVGHALDVVLAAAPARRPRLRVLPAPGQETAVARPGPGPVSGTSGRPPAAEQGWFS
ncbi:MAG TPA: DNA repair protein RadA [Acidimicrobiales bacterium]|nr:DNA repair protein RadA [Acidimicrobiales bacterium]